MSGVWSRSIIGVLSGVADVLDLGLRLGGASPKVGILTVQLLREVAVGLVLGVAVLSIIGLLSRVAGDTLDLVLGAAVLCIGGMLSVVVDVLDLGLGSWLGLWGASPVARDAVGFLLGLGGLCISGVLSGLVVDGCDRVLGDVRDLGSELGKASPKMGFSMLESLRVVAVGLLTPSLVLCIVGGLLEVAFLLMMLRNLSLMRLVLFANLFKK